MKTIYLKIKNILSTGFALAITGVCCPGGYTMASTTHKTCVNTLERRLVRLDTTMSRKLTELKGMLSKIETPSALKLFIADPKAGGQDGRRYFFYLEGEGHVARNYRDNDDLDKDFPALIDSYITPIENQFGKYSEIQESLEAAKGFGMDRTFLTYLNGKQDQSLDQLFKVMKEEGWLGARLTKPDELRRKINELEWAETIEKDHKYYFSAMESTFKWYRKKMVQKMKPLLEVKNWEYMAHMEEGLHEVRRLLRWVMIFMQMRLEAFSYSKPINPQALELTGLALEIAKGSMEDALKRKSPMLDFVIQKKGTIVVRPEEAFLISGLVDRLGALKRKSEIYFKLQAHIRSYLSSGEVLGPLNGASTDIEIQQYLVESAKKSGSSMDLAHYFVPGSENPFETIRSETLELLVPFWDADPISGFQSGANEAHDYWDNKDEND